MQYQGGKSKIAKEICRVIIELTDRQTKQLSYLCSVAVALLKQKYQSQNISVI